MNRASPSGPSKAIVPSARAAYVPRSPRGASRYRPPDSSTSVPSALGATERLFRRYIDWVCANPQGARLLHELRRSGDLAGGGEWEAANAEGFAALREWMDGQVAAGELRAMPFAVFNSIVFAPAITLTPHWVSQAEPKVPPKVRAALEHAAWMGVAP